MGGLNGHFIYANLKRGLAFFFLCSKGCIHYIFFIKKNVIHSINVLMKRNALLVRLLHMVVKAIEHEIFEDVN